MTLNRAAILLISLLIPIYLAVARADAVGGPANLLELRSEAVELLALELRDRLSFRERHRHLLAVHRGELGLRVERLEVRHAARHAEVDDALDLRRVVREVRLVTVAAEQLVGQEPGDCHRADGLAEEAPARRGVGIVRHLSSG